MGAAAAWLIAFALLARNPRTSAEVLDSSQITVDPVAGKKAEAEYLAHLQREDRHLRLRFDREHLREHQAVLAGLREARARYERARAEAAVERALQDVGAMVAEIRQNVRAIDEWRNGSKLFDDYDALIGIVETAYPAALRAAFKGDRRALIAARNEFDARLNKVRSWLTAAGREGAEEDDRAVRRPEGGGD